MISPSELIGEGYDPAEGKNTVPLAILMETRDGERGGQGYIALVHTHPTHTPHTHPSSGYRVPTGSALSLHHGQLWRELLNQDHQTEVVGEFHQLCGVFSHKGIVL